MDARRRSGLSLLEIAVTIAVMAVMVGIAAPGFLTWSSDMRVKEAARAVADALMLGRAEAIRTGNSHIVALAATLPGSTQPIEVADDGAPGTENCTIDAGETVHQNQAIPDIAWGTTTTLANGTPAPDDLGQSLATVSLGWSFSDEAGNPAQWVMFQPDGLPRLFTVAGCDIGDPGEGGGAIYVTNGRRDYAVVLGALGTVRLHAWAPGSGWRD